MDTQDILIVRRIYETGSVTKAANLLYISPQALSKRLQKIESELDTSLFIRTASGMVPTEECVLFYNRSEEFYISFSGFIESIRGKRSGEKVKISVASALGVMALLTPDVITRFRKENPTIELSIREYPDKQVDQLVRDGKADIGLAIEPVNAEEFSRIPIRQYPFCIIAHNNSFLLHRKIISYDDLRDIPIAMENSDFKVYDIITSACKSCGFRPNVYFETLELEHAHSLAEQNKCVAVSVDTERFSPKAGNLMVKRFRNPLYWSIVGIKKSGESFKGAEKIFIDYVCDILSVE